MTALVPSPEITPGIFRQGLQDIDEWSLLDGDKTSGVLTYRKGDEVAVVPNIWYNQPVERRIEAMLWYAARERERIVTLQSDPFPKPWLDSMIASAERSAARLENLAEQMRATGKVLA
jgi:hypothetical protein